MEMNCRTCKYGEKGKTSMPCRFCIYGADEHRTGFLQWERKEEAKEQTNNVKSILEQFMEVTGYISNTKDRYATMTVLPDGTTTISVYPYEVEDEWGEWIDIDLNERIRKVQCSKCGSISEMITPHCPACGNKMRINVNEENKDDD